jgi:hypothetical protein
MDAATTQAFTPRPPETPRVPKAPEPKAGAPGPPTPRQPGDAATKSPPAHLPQLIGSPRVVGDIPPLFERKFKAAEYLYNPVEEAVAEEPFQNEDYALEESMLGSLKGIQVKTWTADGSTGRERGAMLPEELWFKFKRFMTRTVAAKRACEKEIFAQKQKLAHFRMVEDLELKIAKLSSQRIEMMRELAQMEHRFNTEFCVQAKLLELKAKSRDWSSSLQELSRCVGEEKKAHDRLRRGLQSLKRLSRVSDGATTSGDTLFEKQDILQKVGGSECKIIYQASRVIGRRFCLITVYSQPGAIGTAALRDLPQNWPYADVTQDNTPGTYNRGIGSRSTGLGRDDSGMAMLLRALASAPSDTGPGLPVLLISSYDVQRAEYSLIETLPSVQALSESEEKARDSMETRDALVIAQTAFENYLASLVDSTELKMDEVTGRLQIVLPSQLPPLRVLHQGFRELRGAIGYFFVTLYEYTRKTVLIRVHDNAECKLFSHLASVESILGHDPREEASQEQANGEDVPAEDVWAVEQRIVRIILERLDFSGSELTLAVEERHEPEDEVKGRPVSALDLARYRDPSVWPPSLVVNKIKVVNDKVHLTRAQLSPTDRLISGMIYEPMSSVFHDKLVNLDEYLRSLETHEASSSGAKAKLAKSITNLLNDNKPSKILLDTDAKQAAKKYDTAEMQRFLLEFVQRLTLVNGELEISFEEDVEAAQRPEIEDHPSARSNNSGIEDLSLSLVGKH